MGFGENFSLKFTRSDARDRENKMGFGESFSLKFTRSDARDGERWSINSEAQLIKDVDCLQGINHSRFHY